MRLTKKGNLFLVTLVSGLCIAFGVLSYLYQPHEKVEERTADFTGSSEQFLEKIKSVPDAWVNKIVVLSGVISFTDGKSIQLGDQIFCQLDTSENTSIQSNTSIQLKGRVIGYDDLFEELKLDQCIVIKP